MQVVKDGTPIKSKSLKTRGAQAHHFEGEIPRGIITPLSNTPSWALHLNAVPHEKHSPCGKLCWITPSESSNPDKQLTKASIPRKIRLRASQMSHSENLQSLPMSYHFGYAKAYTMLTHVEFFLMRSKLRKPLREGLTQVRVLLTPNSLWQGPYWKCKGRFLERLKCIRTPWSASVKDPLIGNLHPLAPNSTVWSVSP